jgi:hypothetical protein
MAALRTSEPYFPLRRTRFRQAGGHGPAAAVGAFHQQSVRLDHRSGSPNTWAPWIDNDQETQMVPARYGRRAAPSHSSGSGSSSWLCAMPRAKVAMLRAPFARWCAPTQLTVIQPETSAVVSWAAAVRWRASPRRLSSWDPRLRKPFRSARRWSTRRVRSSNPRSPGETRPKAILCLHTGHIGRSAIELPINPYPRRS